MSNGLVAHGIDKPEMGLPVESWFLMELSVPLLVLFNPHELGRGRYSQAAEFTRLGLI